MACKGVAACVALREIALVARGSWQEASTDAGAPRWLLAFLLLFFFLLPETPELLDRVGPGDESLPELGRR